MSNPNTDDQQKKYKGVRRRKWGKFVSEIRVPGTQERLWLGSYSTAEAAAVAHDVASYCLKSGDDGRLNFPLMLPATVRADMSPRSIQRAASDAGMAIDAQMILNNASSQNDECSRSVEDYGNWSGGDQSRDGEEGLNISVEDYL
ncbi:ethylene-responsive transcription factor ERF019 [Mercurialis annua]|uniref:ethylene-responsive transcription factor ERF019 n=1 Tax=Mercurialis annua TaxID=3986 RepID=UPI00215F0A40|nr:ethylene-responsive transcription factor ERF019 [Mercurialis annua]